jgi:hypothetical protein
MWEPQLLTNLRASLACYRDSFTVFIWKSNETWYMRYAHKILDRKPEGRGHLEDLGREFLD